MGIITDEEKIREIFEEQKSEIRDKSASWDERNLLCWNGEKFLLNQDSGNNSYTYSDDFSSPSIEIFEIGVDEVSTDEEFEVLCDILEKKRINFSTEELKEEIEEGIGKVTKKYNIDPEEIEIEAKKGILGEMLFDTMDDIIAEAKRISEEIKEYEEN